MTVNRNYVFAWSALYSSITAAVVATVAWASRYGASEPCTTKIIAFVAIAWLLINAPILARSLFSGIESQLLTNIGAWILGCLAMVLGAGWFLGKAAALPLIAAGICAFIVQCLGVVRMRHPYLASFAFPLAVVTGLSLAGIIWGDVYLSPTFEERLVHGRGHIDELFHITVSNMIRTYGLPSTGLDGVPYVRYHYGSHYALAALGQLVDASGIQVYNLGYPIVFLPLFVFALQAAAMMVLRPHISVPAVASIWVVWFTPMTIIGGVFPVGLTETAALWMSSVTSESMCWALILFLCALALAVPSVTATGSVEMPAIDRKLAAVTAPALMIAITAAKVSVGAVLLSLAAYLYLRLPGLRRSALAAVTMAVTAVAFLIAYHFVSPQGHGAAIAPFDFVWSYVQRRRYRALYLPLSLAWLAAAICIGLVARKVLSNGVRRSLRDTHLIELELIVVTMIASLGPGLLLRIAGGSAFYFIDVQRWVSVLFLIPFAIEYLSMLTPRSFVFGRPFELRRTLAWLVLGLTVVASIGVMIANTAHRLRIVADTVLSDRSGASFGSWEALIQLPRIGGEGRPEDQRRLQLLDTFRAIQRLPSFEKQRTVLYIPKTNRAYWDFFSVTAAPPLRKAVPFLAQAVAGVAMIDGLPDPDPEVAWTAYGYEAYALPREPQVRSSLEQSRDDVLRKAQRAGFARVIVVQENSDGIGIKEWCIETAIPCGLLRAEG